MSPEPKRSRPSTREKLRRMLRDGKLDEREIELEMTQQNIPMVEIFSASGLEEMDINIKDMFGNLLPKKTARTRSRFPRPSTSSPRKKPRSSSIWTG